MSLTVQLLELATLFPCDWKLPAFPWWEFHQRSKITKAEDGGSGYPTVPERHKHWRERITCPREKGKGRALEIHEKVEQLGGSCKCLQHTDFLRIWENEEFGGILGSSPIPWAHWDSLLAPFSKHCTLIPSDEPKSYKGFIKMRVISI